MKAFACLLCASALLLADDRPGNFDLRAEPTAQLQTEAQIPFQIRVRDDLGKPLVDAKVTLQIETPEHERTQVYKAPAVDPGVYLAKPVFPVPGAWSVYVEVRRGDQITSRTWQYNIPRAAP